MSTVDTSTWNPDADLNTAIEGIPLNADAGIAQTWQVIRILMAAFKGDTSAIQALMVPFSGATASADGASGLVPAPQAGDQDKVLKGDGTWSDLAASQIPALDASKIASGTIDLARLPAGALERLVTVADQTARFALTTASVQLGDTVKQLDTGIMYLVVDTTKLGQAAGYVEYTAGSAASVPWSGVTGKPSAFTPSSHSHGSITNDGKLGTASRAVQTDATGAIDISSVTATELGYLSGVTSAVQTQLDAKAADATVVHTTGNETVNGLKTLAGEYAGNYPEFNQTSNHSLIFRGVARRDAAGQSCVYLDKYRQNVQQGSSCTTALVLGLQENTSWFGGVEIGCNYSVTATSVDSSLYLTPYHNLFAGADGKTVSKTSSLGTASSPWDNFSCNSGPWSSSDARLKSTVEGLSDALMKAWDKVDFKKFKFNDAIAKKGDGARIHVGVIAQEVAEAFASEGLDAGRYGLFGYDRWEDRYEDGRLVQEGGDRYSIRYEEALVLECACLRKKVRNLEARITALEEAMHD